MLQSFQNIFQIPELRRRVLYTFGVLAAFRVGSWIPVPGINPIALEGRAASAGMLGFLNLFTGGALQRFSVFALGIMPYISASIILQLLTVVWPYLEKLSKEGEAGRRKINEYTRYLTVGIAMIQAAGVAIMAQSQAGVVLNPGVWFRLQAILVLTTGTMFLMWLGERISERGIGNGISLLIFAGIIVDIPSALVQSAQQFETGEMNIIKILVIGIIMVATIWLVIWVERAQRRIPVQYAKRVVGRRVMMGQSTHLPLRLNTGGVIPVVFASTIVMIPSTLGGFLPAGQLPWAALFLSYFSYGTPLYQLLYFAAIVFFCYFYVSIIFNPVDVADNIKKYGGFIPGKRPGARTAEYIDTVLSRITLGGAVYLAAVALLPMILISGTQLDKLPLLGPVLGRVLPQFILQGLGVPFYFGGTSLLIVVGVAMDTMQQIESQMIMRHYEGFLKGSRVRGRRG